MEEEGERMQRIEEREVVEVEEKDVEMEVDAAASVE